MKIMNYFGQVNKYIRTPAFENYIASQERGSLSIDNLFIK